MYGSPPHARRWCGWRFNCEERVPPLVRGRARGRREVLRRDCLRRPAWQLQEHDVRSRGCAEDTRLGDDRIAIVGWVPMGVGTPPMAAVAGASEGPDRSASHAEGTRGARAFSEGLRCPAGGMSPRSVARQGCSLRSHFSAEPGQKSLALDTLPPRGGFFLAGHLRPAERFTAERAE